MFIKQGMALLTHVTSPSGPGPTVPLEPGPYRVLWQSELEGRPDYPLPCGPGLGPAPCRIPLWVPGGTGADVRREVWRPGPGDH